MVKAPRWLVAASPHLPGLDSTPRIMWTVVITLIPICLVGFVVFGPSAALVLLASILGCLLPERIWGNRGSLGDGSAVITGILLGLTLPPGFPLWMAFLGGFFGIAFGKVVFGGLGQNPFNPALLGRAFLQAAFPVAITTWPKAFVNWGDVSSNLAWPLMKADAPDTITESTPLGVMFFGEAKEATFPDLLLGSTGGSIGETAGLLILICGGFLALKSTLR